MTQENINKLNKENLLRWISDLEDSRSRTGVDWIIWKDHNGNFIPTLLEGNNHIGTHQFTRVCDSTNFMELTPKLRGIN
jgi:hypothetical protein